MKEKRNEPTNRSNKSNTQYIYCSCVTRKFTVMTDNQGTGRFPSHLLLSHAQGCTREQCVPGCPALEMNEQSGLCKPGGETVYPKEKVYIKGFMRGSIETGRTLDKSGYGASRYFKQFYHDDISPQVEGDYNMTDNQILHGDSLEILRTLPDNSVDAIVSDPPAGIAFMGKEWDNFSDNNKRAKDYEAERLANREKYYGNAFACSHGSGIATKKERDGFITFLSAVMAEAYRTLKPGGHGLIWALPRTSHWTALALEDAGFEIRDSIYHIFGSGFPKSLDVSKAIDKHFQAEREVIGISPNSRFVSNKMYANGHGLRGSENYQGDLITAPATTEAQQFAGFGSALKPAVEVWWLIRKPLSEKSIAANVLRWGTGGINIDGCRIPGEDTTTRHNSSSSSYMTQSIGSVQPKQETYITGSTSGRFPSHLLLSHSLFCTPEQCAEECPVRVMDEQSGILKTGSVKPYTYKGGRHNPSTSVPMFASKQITGSHTGDSGGASRYFARFYYTSKASRSERNAGCEELPVRAAGVGNVRPSGDFNQTLHHDGRDAVTGNNHHPTVKPLSLMSYLIRLITPPDGIVLDPFAGSGTTGIACIQENKRFILIEREEEYIQIIHARIAHAYKQKEAQNGHYTETPGIFTA